MLLTEPADLGSVSSSPRKGLARAGVGVACPAKLTVEEAKRDNAWESIGSTVKCF